MVLEIAINMRKRRNLHADTVTASSHSTSNLKEKRRREYAVWKYSFRQNKQILYLLLEKHKSWGSREIWIGRSLKWFLVKQKVFDKAELAYTQPELQIDVEKGNILSESRSQRMILALISIDDCIKSMSNKNLSYFQVKWGKLYWH